MWPMDEERPPRLPVRDDAHSSGWSAGQRRVAGSEKGDDNGADGASPRSGAGVIGRVGSLPYLECLAAPAMQFGGREEEPQGGSPMQVSSSTVSGCTCGFSDRCDGAKGAQDSGPGSDCLRDRQRNNSVHAGNLVYLEVRSSAQGDSQQQHDAPERPTYESAGAQRISAAQEPAPAPTAYREQPSLHAINPAADCSDDGSGGLAQQGAASAARQPNGHANGFGSAGGASMPSPSDPPQQPPSTGTSPQHHRKRSRLRMDAACRSRCGDAAASLGTSETAAAGTGAAANGRAAAGQHPVKRSFELRLVPATPDVRPDPVPAPALTGHLCRHECSVSDTLGFGCMQPTCFMPGPSPRLEASASPAQGNARWAAGDRRGVPPVPKVPGLAASR